ncbi:hypothetical protein MJO29_008122 [Puccinia striiformis f. sp. tritici]|uniref:RecQ-mediated genome instability protein 1 n=1 Tax=Puccinia striiformis f. sp. tritici PST-78 TaxID=1165861 RepID=A0A0L0VGG9_9BASI|nr:hypothetical protein Pst134EA_015729 [Puccinia striiformis f. sp. tritici]KAI9606403.1 hypothetical protein KEM48_001768 [Puccinia striiformis f. sp. tritici PST-130]KNE98079.1 hypothetical protein PSTG_08753 [Puccinia striiformis f. sp. tritici PST-78]KAH9452872.1 hypothetical protein Pst134EB_016823 [Puccinia striiformis f. sp. tritici]KAH9463644.1 hypothetical protein Pst134EA_015729 [Puccinia striiformis f. sp. tritici]KAI7952491.1 hypothetical protein MJO29_008122 [Puccinia striiformis
MADSAVPRAVRNWFKTTYPSVIFNEAWLTQCCEYLQTHFDLTPPQLIKKIENQLLLSDLSTSTTNEGSPLTDLRNSETEEVERQIKIKELPPNRGVLVQIQSITEIGHSALSLQTVHSKIMDDVQGRDRVLDLEDPESEDRQAPIVYPRAMLKLTISDGHHSLPAIEYQKIEGLNLSETPLGCKLLIKAATVRRGIVLLTPENTTIKGFQVDELDSNRDRIFQEGLNARLNRTGEPEDLIDNGLQQVETRTRNRTTATSSSLQSAPIVNTHDDHHQRVIELSDSDDYFDDNSDFEAQLLAHQI